MTVVALALLAGSSWTLGRLALCASSWPELRRYERLALELTAGLGLVALCLSLLALAGFFQFATPVLALLSLAGIVLAVRGPRPLVVPIVGRWRLATWASGVVLAAPLLLPPVVGVVRAVRYVSDPANFLYTYTERYADIQWANTHLDRRVHRIGSIFPDVGYLEIPFILFAPTYQMELSFEELNDPDLFLNACRRQGITHLFGGPRAFPEVLAPHLRVIYDNPGSLRGSEHFFRAPRTEHTTLFEILP